MSGYGTWAGALDYASAGACARSDLAVALWNRDVARVASRAENPAPGWDLTFKIKVLPTGPKRAMALH